MSNRDVNPFDWYRSLFGRSGISWRGDFYDNMFRDFDEIRKEMNRTFSEQFKNFENIVPKDLVKEYDTPEGGKVREVGPIVYGYSMTIGPDGKPKIREFGNVKSPLSGKGEMGLSYQYPSISAEREPLVDISSTDKEIKLVAEMPGIRKENIKINAYDNTVEITSDNPQRKYHKVIDLPIEADTETAKSTYNNGILEVVFNKKKEAKLKGKEIKIE